MQPAVQRPRSAQKRKVRRFHDLLKDELEIRARKNPQYSLRAFARDLGVAPSKLSEIIRGRRGLSVRTVTKLSERLGLADHESKYYLLHVQLTQAKDAKKKAKIRKELKELEVEFRFFEMQVENRVPLTWLHHGVLEGMALPEFKFDKKWIAARFGISEDKAKEVMGDLERMGLFRIEDGKVKRLSRLIKFVPSPGVDAIELRRQDYAGLLDRTKKSILEDEIGTFLSSTQYMALPEACLEDLRALIHEFKNKVVGYYNSSLPAERVYCLNINFIALDQKKDG